MNEYTKETPSKELKWIGVDLDGTLSTYIWPEPGIGAPLPGAVEAMKEIVKNGYKIVIYTARPWGHYESIEKWCKDNGIEASRIVCGKLLLKYMIDDKNIEFKGDWDKVIKGMGL